MALKTLKTRTALTMHGSVFRAGCRERWLMQRKGCGRTGDRHGTKLA
jgi:hypothetical protein